MKKYIFSLLLLALMISALGITAFAAEDSLPVEGSCGENLTWHYDADSKTLTISGTGAMTEMEGYPWSCYGDCTDRIVIEEGVTYVAPYAFSHQYAGELSLASTVSDIADYAFEMCMLDELNLPEGLKSIGENAFVGNPLSSVRIPASVTSMGPNPFQACTNMQEIIVAEENPVYYSDEEGVVFSKDLKILYMVPSGYQGGYTVPESVVEIAHSAFGSCFDLKYVEMFDGVKKIGEEAFFSVYQMNSIHIPDSVTSIGAGAFDTCTYLMEVTLPENLEVISEGLFRSCNYLTELEIPNKVTRIEKEAFAYCHSLGRIRVPGSVKEIGTGAFLGIDDPLFVTLEDGVERIAAGAFEECNAIGYIVIPAGLKEIGTRAFDGLNHVLYKGSEEQWEEISIDADNEVLNHAVKHFDCIGDEILYNTKIPHLVYPFCEVCNKIYACGGVQLPFVDTKATAYYSVPVHWAFNTGVTIGVDDTHFAPNKVCTRAEVVTFLWRALNCETTYAPNPFVDVSEDDYYYDAVRWAVDDGILKGRDATHFDPDAPCTRAEAITFLWRIGGPNPRLKECPFVDVPEKAFFTKAVLWAVEEGIAMGTSADRFSPYDHVTRAQCVTFMFREFKDGIAR